MSSLYSKLKGSIKLFRELSVMEIESLVKNSPRRFHQKNAAIYRSGSLGNEIFIIISGKAVVMEGSDGFEYEDEFLESGDHFGLAGFASGKPRTDSVICTEDNTLILSISEFQVLKIARIAYKIYKSVAEELSRQTRIKNKKLSKNKKNELSARLKDTLKEYHDNRQSFEDMTISDITLNNKYFTLINFSFGAFHQSIFKGVNVSRVNGRASNWSMAEFDGTQFRSCDFSDSDFNANKFNKVIFSNCFFNDVTLDDTDFSASQIVDD
ncbi:MAG: cyclic nucleotide-binding domain-containing protein [SAR324 cluster bacterium]|nr:cyclic nucleotide-binding domain-containing protein [SAR324 cluster bacterium]